MDQHCRWQTTTVIRHTLNGGGHDGDDVHDDGRDVHGDHDAHGGGDRDDGHDGDHDDGHDVRDDRDGGHDDHDDDALHLQHLELVRLKCIEEQRSRKRRIR
ncbi:hypothetical protein CDAR_549941 [Caerostris darwini]|uniref:Uncharacterized protein n=1 Tax=Caerostris darwini TaxID=1538125 RepID=A0AAV4QDM1_9ARAC|nr:hypothetical protein CDAR_549941 [Caerostris darwini]